MDPEILIGSGMKEIAHGGVRNRFVEFDIMFKTAVESLCVRAASPAANDFASIGRAGAPFPRSFEQAALGEGG